MTMYLTPGSLSSNKRKHHIWGVVWCGGPNLQTKLSRRSDDEVYVHLGCTHWSSGWAQPNSPPQSPELSYDRWARGATKQSAGPLERGRALTEVSTSVSWPRNRRQKSIPTLLRAHGLCAGCSPAVATAVFLVETQ